MTKEKGQLNFEQLPRYQPRRFVPTDANLKDKDTVVGLFQKLLDRVIRSQAEFEQWLLDRSELDAATRQAGDILYIKMTCQTDNTTFANDYTQFIETIVPAVQPLSDQLNRKYLADREKFLLPEKKYQVYDRERREDLKLFRQENVELFTKVQLLSQEYQKICGAMTVRFKGKEQTMPAMSKYLEEPNRILRAEAWQASAERRRQDAEKLDQLFDQMLKLRVKIAQNAGCKNFTEYQFKSYHRFDYTPQDCKQYHSTMEHLLVPVLKQIKARRRKQMRLNQLRPWDSAVDPLGRPPLRPFKQVKKLITGASRIFHQVDSDLGDKFDEMINKGLLDLASRKGKAPGGYQNTLDEARLPFIFMNAVGTDDDIYTLLHEGGHAFHAFLCSSQKLVDYRHGPMEFNEVASMAMELLADPFLAEFYGKEELKRSQEAHWESVLDILVWVAVIDGFQHWIYENPKHDQKQRWEAWLSIYDRFLGGFTDWKGLEKFKEVLWHRQLHIFEVPFYYIEYGIAQLGALQVWLNTKKDFKQAVEFYKKGLRLGGSRPLPEIYKTAGIRFDFSEKTIAPLVDAVKTELNLI